MNRQRGERSILRSEPRPLLLWVLLFLALLIYLPALQNGYIWDDDSYVTGNETLRTVNGLHRIWFEIGALPQYYPMVHTSYWVEYRIWELRPFGYHLVNVLLHGLNGILLWVLLRRLAVPGAWVAALIFIVHPVHVESVAWITERKNVLSGAFYLGAMLAYFRFAPPDSSPPARHRWRYHALALVLFLCALLSKTVTASWPAAVLLIVYWKRGRVRWADVRPLLPMVGLGVALGSVTVWTEKHHVGAEGESWDLSPAERVLVAGRALWFYTGKLLWPTRLAFIYPRWAPDPTTLRWIAYPVGAVAVIVTLALQRNRWGRGPLVAVLFFAGTLVPALGFFNVYPFRFSFVADHFQYLASIGIIVLVVAVAAIAVRGSVRVWMGAALGLMVVGTLGGATWKQTRIYASQETLWMDTIARDPGSWMAHTNLGAVLLADGRVEEAHDHYLEVVRIKPDYAEGWNNLGNAVKQMGRLEEATEHYHKAVRIDPMNADVGMNLANVLAAQGKVGPAMTCYRLVLRTRPDEAAALTNLGHLLLTQDEVEAALDTLTLAVRHNPVGGTAWFNLAVARHRKGRLEEAVVAYRSAIANGTDSADIRFGLGLALAELDRPEEAAREFAATVRRNPNHTGALERLRTLEGEEARP